MQSKVKAMREANGWSQEQLAEMAGLSTRTIQRIENGQRAGLESWKSLAAVFETTIRDLQGENDMNTTVENTRLAEEETRALQEVRRLRGWYIGLMRYAAVMLFLLVVNWLISPDYWWVVWPALGWGLAIVLRGVTLFTPWRILGDDWERREVEKRIGRKL
ncbi:helix-turn-helix domain-containing protein [Cardiobacteriaceae bacterium TAE3-ERU3]|nr:helix-turn-helix domain-containing protein [Cardiobacteriaceae bacterium TAE3-ERU3]